MTIIKRPDGLIQHLKSEDVYCDHCGERVEWVRFFDSYYCTDCKTDDVNEKLIDHEEGDLNA